VNLISAPGQGLFAVNVFTVRPENQRPLIDCIRAAGHQADVPGLLSMHLLRSLDGTQVINHMHWADEEAFRRATRENPVIAATRRQVDRLIEGAGPNLYEIVEV
jgi:heme-degrading monooxygenase HmoA